jgi:hypothetical protein
LVVISLIFSYRNHDSTYIIHFTGILAVDYIEIQQATDVTQRLAIDQLSCPLFSFMDPDGANPENIILANFAHHVPCSRFPYQDIYHLP